MLEDPLDDLFILDESDDLHPPLAFRSRQGINLIDFLNQPGSVLSVFLQVLIVFEDQGDKVVNLFLSRIFSLLRRDKPEKEPAIWES